MLLLVYLLFIWCANAYSPRCTNMSDTSMKFRPTEDGVWGRYRTELCTQRKPNVTEWTIDLVFFDSAKYCNVTASAGTRSWTWRGHHEHSANTVPIEDTTNCTHVCYSMDLDLIFSSCYGIKSTMTVTGGIKEPPYDTFHLVNNNLTIESIRSNKPHVNFINHDDQVTLIWYLGIPSTNYKVGLCQTHNATGAAIPDACEDDLPNVTDNCTSDELHNELHCVFAPEYGGYTAMVEHYAPWISGVFSPQKYTSYDFFHRKLPEPSVSAGGGGAVWWACGGALALAGAALAAAAARTALRRGAYHKQVLEEWRRQRLESEPSTPAAVEPELGCQPILLLYAREGEHGQLVIDQLVELLQRATSSPVYSLFSGAWGALAGAAPHEWVRAALRRRGVRVLLLQTPALAALYRARLQSTDNLKLVEPLLGRRVLYRAPQFADALLQYALRLLVLDPHAHHAYHKYYLATLTDLSTDILQQVVPYRRYALPGAVTALVRDLGAAPAPAEPDPLLLDGFQRAVDRFVTHATENPNYLMDELLVMAGN